VQLELVKVWWNTPQGIDDDLVQPSLETRSVVLMDCESPESESVTPAVGPGLVNEEKVHGLRSCAHRWALERHVVGAPQCRSKRRGPGQRHEHRVGSLTLLNGTALAVLPALPTNVQ
jgi:hypothetical protein